MAIPLPTMSAPPMRRDGYEESTFQKTCHICGHKIDNGTVSPTLSLTTENVLFKDMRASIHFCWDCFEAEAGNEWKFGLLEKAYEIEKRRLGDDHPLIKKIKADIDKQKPQADFRERIYK